MLATKKLTCFVIAPIGPNDSDTRKRSDKVLKHIFKKALEEKYEVVRGDGIDEPGMITSQVLRAVQESHLVVADLTEHNPNVLYELAVRHAIEKPIIHVIEPRLSKIPFDIAGFRTIDFNLTDPDSIEFAVDKLRKYAEQAESGQWGETPIKLANIMRASKEDSAEMLLLKQAVEGISRVSARLERIDAWSPYYGNILNVRGLGSVVNPLSQDNVYASVTGSAINSSPTSDSILVQPLTPPLSYGILTLNEPATKAPIKEDKKPSPPKATPKK